MANLYVRSGDGSDAENGTTWALAKATVIGAAAIDSAGDHIFLSDNHAESNASNTTWSFAGTAASPTWIVCVDDTSDPEPPIAVATTATVATASGVTLSMSGYAYFYGITFNISASSGNALITLAVGTDEQTFENCVINLVGTGSNNSININALGNVQPSRVIFNNVNVTFPIAGSGITLVMGSLEWYGGAILTGPDLTTGLIRPSSAGEYNTAIISGVDLTEVGVTGYLVAKTSNSRVNVKFIDCKLPAFTTGGLYSGTLQAGDRIEVYNCDSADTNYRLWIGDQWGSIVSDTSVYNDSGADDGSAQGFSWKMASSANAEFPHQVLVSPEIVKWNDTTTGTLTATVEIVHNSQGSGTSGALLDSEIWLEVMCMDPGATPIGKWQSDKCANLNLNSNAADQASSSAAWTGDSAGWDTQKLVVSFTPKEKGYVHARVRIAKASATVYVDPLLTIA